MKVWVPTGKSQNLLSLALLTSLLLGKLDIVLVWQSLRLIRSYMVIIIRLINIIICITK